MTQPDLSQSQECTKQTTVECCEICLVTCEYQAALKECTFCSNSSESAFDVEYPMTGLVRHCRECAIEYGVAQSYPQKLSTGMCIESDTQSDQHF